MSRFYFDTSNGPEGTDQDGLEFANASEAKDAALDWVRREAVARPPSPENDVIEIRVRDERAQVIFVASMKLSIRESA